MAVDRRKFLQRASLLAVGASPLLGLMAGAPRRGLASGAAASSDSAESADAATRWAMIIDARKMLQDPEELKRCAEACHQAHNVPKFPNAKDTVKWIWEEPFEHVFPGQGHDFMDARLKGAPVLTLCNHCDNPPCVRVCPTKATFRRPDGIVAMDMHRCIGCRFCIAACPYGSRSFNWKDPRPAIERIDPSYPTRTKGVVEKCNFCAERLAKGQQPACVTACKSGAIVFGNIQDETSAARKALESNFTIRRKPELGTLPHVFYIVTQEG